MYLIAALCIVMSFLEVNGFCPSQCTCSFHGRSDSPRARSVLCSDPDMYEIPVNVPVDTAKLRIEKTVVRKIPREAFYYLVDLKYLWLTYNSVANVDTRSFYNLKQLHELRMDGNLLSSFPWESLAEMPNLRTLDLHNNKVTAVPAEAGRYLRNLTYLDLSSNRLTSLPSDLMDMWLPSSEMAPLRNLDSTSQRVILGLQDNPWYCDCRISKLIGFSRTAAISVMLLDSLVACSGPENLAGILFQKVELERCLKPLVMTSATKITSTLGSKVLLRCDATGYPTPQLSWVTTDNLPVNATAIQESPGDGIRWSIISLTAITYEDAGDYRCKAKNMAGISEASVTVTVVNIVTTTVPPIKHGKMRTEQQNATHEEMKQVLIKTTVSAPTISTLYATMAAATDSLVTERTTEKKQPKAMSDGKGNSKTIANGSKKQPGDIDKENDEASLSVTAAADKTFAVKNLTVTPEFEERVKLTWKFVNATSNSSLTVFFSKYGAKDMLPLSPDPTTNKVTIDGLEPSNQYMICVCPKGSPPTKDQCIIFSTKGIMVEEDDQNSILLVTGSVACIIVLALVFLLLYKILMFHRKPKSTWENDMAKETYVKFDTLSFKTYSQGTGGELWAYRDTDMSEKLLLCSRSSVESQVTF